jgi:hypothetical protein
LDSGFLSVYSTGDRFCGKGLSGIVAHHLTFPKRSYA